MEKLINDIRQKSKKIIKTKDSKDFITQFVYKRNINKILLLYHRLITMIYNTEVFTVYEILQLIKLINTRGSKSINGIIDIKGDSLGFINEEYSIRYQIFKDTNTIKYNYYDNEGRIGIEKIYNKIKNSLNFENLRNDDIQDRFAVEKLINIIECYIYDIISKEGIKNDEILNRLYFIEE